MEKKLIQNTKDHFEKLFQKPAKHIFLSPGRINIIGEHVDYNDGFVLPAAINKYICFAISENKNSAFLFCLLDFSERFGLHTEFQQLFNLAKAKSVDIGHRLTAASKFLIGIRRI